MAEFSPHRLSDLRDARAGDVVHWQRKGWLPHVLSWLIWKVKEPAWDRWDWHLTPVVYVGTPSQINAWCQDLDLPQFTFDARADIAIDAVLVDAQFPQVKLSLLSSYIEKGREGRAYRVVPVPPPQWKVDRFTTDHVGHYYDILTYILRALRCFWDIPRIIDRSFDCWDTAFDACECWGFDPADGTDYDWNYPWLPDLRRAYREIPRKGTPK